MSATTALFLATLLLPAELVSPRPDQAPATVEAPTSRLAEPLEHRLLSNPRELLREGPDAWCPVGTDFRAWLEDRERLARPPRLAKAAARVELVDGVVVIEDDGTMLRGDRRPDLEGLTVELVPDGDGYAVGVGPVRPEPDVGAALFTDQRGWFEETVSLAAPFAFPFGGEARSDLVATSAFGLHFGDPEPPGPAQLHLRDQLPDRSLRIAPWQQGTSLAGRDFHYLQLPDRAVFAWRAVEGGWLDVEIQAVLHGDGRIEFHYVSLLGLNHGGPAVVDGNSAWWAEETPAGTVTNPEGDVPVAAPDGPAIDIVEVRAFQVADSELVQVEVELAAPLPAATDGRLQFVWDIRDEPGGEIVVQLWAEWEDGAWNWSTYAPVIVGNAIRFQLSKAEMGLEDEDFEIVAWTAQDWAYHQAVVAEFSYPRTPTQAVLSDYSEADGSRRRGPLLEPFTLPELNIGPVYQAVLDHFENPRLDGLAVYQNFLTDIVFYAGAWSTVGNAGADGIGTGSSAEPEGPALLHMNALGYGWNSWDEGKVTVLNHEYGHHWLYFPSVDEGGTVGKPLGDGHPAGGVHAPAAAPVYNDWDASCMGGSTWTDNADGTFTSAPGFASFGYSWHELYLMGLADASEVDPWFYLRDSDPALPGAYWPAEDLTVSATRVDVAVDQLVTAMGPRSPAVTESRRDFVVPLVLLTRPGEWSQDDVDELVRTCQVWEPQFHAATAERGTVTCDRVGDRPPVPVILDPPVGIRVSAGSELDFFGTATDPDGDEVELTWNFGTLAAETSGEGPHRVGFPEPGLFVVQLAARDETGRPSDWPDVRVVEVTCATPMGEVDGLRVARPEPGTLAFTWTEPFEPVDDVVLLEATDPRGPWAEVQAGLPGLTTPERSGNRFFLVAARNLPDCLGPS